MNDGVEERPKGGKKILGTEREREEEKKEGMCVRRG